MKPSLVKNFRIGPLAGIGIGSALMYYFDPQRGAKRRARIFEKAIHSTHKTEDLLDKATRDLVNRGQGFLAKARNRTDEKEVSNEILVARVRSKLGRYVSHPHAIEVGAGQGKVILKGLILEHELEPLLSHLKQVKGIQSVESQLEAHHRNENVPSLQGGFRRTGERLDIFQTNWAPATRVMVGTLGVGLGVFGLTRKNTFGSFLGLLGIGAVSRALTNLEFQRLFGIGSKRTAIRVQKMINIDAPVERVFEFWSNLENFPRFLSDVKEVRVSKGIQSHWNISGPAGTPISWDAIITKKIPNKLLAWKTMPGSIIPNSGLIRFRPNEQGGTRIDLDLSYHPPIGVVGHFAAHLFGTDPKSKLDDALSQIKTLIEQGPSERQLKRIAS